MKQNCPLSFSHSLREPVIIIKALDDQRKGIYWKKALKICCYFIMIDMIVLLMEREQQFLPTWWVFVTLGQVKE